VLVAAQNATRNLNVHNDFVNFSPRLGVAYLVNDKTVVRSGFAIFHSTFWVDNGAEVTFPGWTYAQTFPSRGIGVAQDFTLSQGFPVSAGGLAVPDPLALFNAATVSSPLAVSSVSYDSDDNMPYSVQWNFGVQRQVGWGAVIDLAYVASRSLNLERTVAGNSPGLELDEPRYYTRAGAYQWLIGANEAGFPFVRSSNVGIGNLGRNTSRGPAFYNLNLGAFRKFQFGERFSAEIRGEAFNALNTVNFNNPNTNIDSANHGLITGTAGGRQIQIGLRLAF
jgi:hypothetical protein